MGAAGPTAFDHQILEYSTVMATVGNPEPIISAGSLQYFPSMSDLSLLDTSMLVAYYRTGFIGNGANTR